MFLLWVLHQLPPANAHRIASLRTCHLSLRPAGLRRRGPWELPNPQIGLFGRLASGVRH